METGSTNSGQLYWLFWQVLRCELFGGDKEAPRQVTLIAFHKQLHPTRQGHPTTNFFKIKCLNRFFYALEACLLNLELSFQILFNLTNNYLLYPPFSFDLTTTAEEQNFASRTVYLTFTIIHRAKTSRSSN